MSKLLSYYQNYDEGNRLEKTRWQKFEFKTTLEILKPYLAGAESLLELGAATGKYSLYYAAQGLQVRAVDIVPEHIEQLQQKAVVQGLQNVQAFSADASRGISCPDESFDAVLCLGPYYHLRKVNERLACLQECVRLLKPGGILALAYINRFSAIPYYFKAHVPLTVELLEQLLGEDYTFTSGVDTFLDIGHFSTPEQVLAEVNRTSLQVIDHIGVDGIYSFFSKDLEEMDEEQYALLDEYHRRTCREPSILGCSAHGLLVCRK